MNGVSKKLGTIYKGEKVNYANYLNGELMSYGTNNHAAVILSVLAKHIEALREAVATWKQRKKNASTKDKGYAQWHLDYLESELKQETETHHTLTKN
jgi:hypothetical protein